MSDQKSSAGGWVIYPIGSRPRWGLAFLLGIQQYLTMFGATVLVPLIIGGAMKVPIEEQAILISTVFFCMGIATLIQQSPIGNRLPIVQGSSFSFLPPTFAIIGLVSAQSLGWQVMIQQVAIAIMVASLFEIILGYTGLMGYIKRAISPVVIAPTITMIGISLFALGIPAMSTNWGISIITIACLILFSQVFARFSRVFLLFPVLLAILAGWIASLIGSATGLISAENAAYMLGERLGAIRAAPWFTIRHMIPFKFGFPDFGSIFIAGAFGMLAGYLASMIESIGDYYSCSRISGGPVPTERMISRGLGAEGIGCLIAGLFQSVAATTSYSENIGAIGLTRVASRRVIRAGAIVMLVIPLLGKFSTALATMPDPVKGAMYVGLFGMIAAVGLSNLQFVNLNNARNLFVIGICLFAGLSMNAHFSNNPIDWSGAGQVAEVLGNILQAIFTSAMSVTAIVGLILDNLLPGATREDRGLAVWESEATDEAWAKAEEGWKKMAVGEEMKVFGK
jgi:nucleobase transporter 1/2